MTEFLLDVMCGGLAVPLRMCGHDTVYALDHDVERDDRLRRWAEETGRTLVTRDRALAEHTDGAILLEERDPDDQLEELRQAGVSLEPDPEPSRCGRCNGPLSTVPPDTTVPEYAPSPAEVDLWRCMRCGQLFWKGSHWRDVRERLDAPR